LGAFSCFPQALKLFNVFLRGDDGKLDKGIGHLVGYVDVASASRLTFSRLEMLIVLGLLLGCSGWLLGMRALHCNPKLIGTLKLTLLSSRRLLFLFVFRNRNPTVFMQPLPASGSGSISACRCNIRLKYHVGRGYYVPNMSELADDEFASDFDKGNANILILYTHP
jgi:hypothetical protein